ncbi:TPA: LysR family transcriptional regulator [Serratia fonticola]|nr:LysR family transcriptional regulator [Serratia fonticola]
MSTNVSPESLRGISNFVVTASCNSFTEAAEALGVTKSAVGKSIARLEERLGTRLFNRSTRKLSLTNEGQTYLNCCLDALEILDAAQHTLCRRQEKPSGVVRIDMPAAFGRDLVMPILIEFTERYPDVWMTLTFNDRLIDPIEEGVDLVLRLGELESTDELIVRRLSKQKLICCASPVYLNKHGTPSKIEELKLHRCIMGYRRGAPLAWRLKDASGQDIRFTVNQQHQIGDGDAMLSACLNGLGITQLPESMVNKYIESGKLVMLLTENQPDPLDLHVLWPRTRHLIPKIRCLVDELVLRAGEGHFGNTK